MFHSKPILVFWETTRACPLSCVHCRASAISDPLPGELTFNEGLNLIDQIASFGKPYPTMILTGGDPLMRKDLFNLMAYASKIGVNFAASPAVSNLLTFDTLQRIKHAGATSISVSLDGATSETHESIRRIEGTFDRTMETILKARDLGLPIQVNTTVMKRNLHELPAIFHLIKTLGIKVWEVFFLIRTGRGSDQYDLTPYEYQSACNFLYDASHYGLIIRCVEAPFIRRVIKERLAGTVSDLSGDETYSKLRTDLLELEGAHGQSSSTLGLRGTLDGDGIIFVGHDGTIYPGGFVPVAIGNVRQDRLVDVYRSSELLMNIRARKFSGFCGECDLREICGGSRARAYSGQGDPLSSDPACIYVSR
ncbi:MAG: TIGR04053 family radical SAM/SPASM domain-containing protein [Nitrososphaerales archaeon]